MYLSLLSQKFLILELLFLHEFFFLVLFVLELTDFVLPDLLKLFFLIELLLFFEFPLRHLVFQRFLIKLLLLVSDLLLSLLLSFFFGFEFLYLLIVNFLVPVFHVLGLSQPFGVKMLPLFDFLVYELLLPGFSELLGCLHLLAMLLDLPILLFLLLQLLEFQLLILEADDIGLLFGLSFLVPPGLFLQLLLPDGLNRLDFEQLAFLHFLFHLIDGGFLDLFVLLPNGLLEFLVPFYLLLLFPFVLLLLPADLLQYLLMVLPFALLFLFLDVGLEFELVLALQKGIRVQELAVQSFDFLLGHEDLLVGFADLLPLEGFLEESLLLVDSAAFELLLLELPKPLLLLSFFDVLDVVGPLARPLLALLVQFQLPILVVGCVRLFLRAEIRSARSFIPISSSSLSIAVFEGVGLGFAVLPVMFPLLACCPLLLRPRLIPANYKTYSPKGAAKASNKTTEPHGIERGFSTCSRLISA